MFLNYFQETYGSKKIMKALFKSTKKHVISNNEPIIHQKYTKTKQDDFLPISMLDNEDERNHSSFQKSTAKPFRTPPTSHKRLFSPKHDVYLDGATDR